MPSRPMAQPTPRGPITPRKPLVHTAGGSSNGAVKRILLTGLLSLVAIVFVGGAGAAAWYLLQKNVSILPTTIAGVFDSAPALIETADETDRELKRLVDGITGTRVSEETIKQISEVSDQAPPLIYRAVGLSPLSESEIRSLGETDEEGNLVGPLNEQTTESMRDKVRGLDKSQQTTMIALIARTYSSTQLVREYLQHGHVELPEGQFEGERLDAQRIELMRDLNRLGAKVMLGLLKEAKQDAKKGKPDTPPTKEESKRRLDALYEPIHDDVSDLAERMYELAEKRYRLPEEERGDRKLYQEAYYYTQQVQGRVFVISLALIQNDASIAGPLGDYTKAVGDYELAAMNIMPTRLAKAEKEQELAAEQTKQREESRQAKIEQQRQQREQALRDQASADQAMQEQEEVPTATNQSGDTDSLADNQSDANGRPPFGAGRFGSPRFGPGGSRGGPRRPGGNRGEQPGDDGPPPMPSMEGGVTIKMSVSGDLDIGEISRSFSNKLGVAVNCQKSGGRLTVRVAHKGSLDDVAELIDFGTVQNIDKSTRTITVSQN